ncbi:MAG TPA: DNA-deoxyinosine glycosylase [Candidatus Butyricicoccus avicola]|nr:DNA-deoxyinosine glycosylase [Candidatus Butyricicoccus avicola]
MEYTHVTHNFPPLFAPDSRALILGSIPSPKSREQAFFYGHPQNRFWPVLAAVFGEPAPQTIEDKRSLALRHRIAMWDTLAACDIRGASDTSIRNPVANDLPWLIAQTRVRAVFCTGATSYKYYKKLCQPQTGIEAVCLPSTSPANAAWSKERLIQAYSVIAQAVAD